jgi:hypothetical protein
MEPDGAKLSMIFGTAPAIERSSSERSLWAGFRVGVLLGRACGLEELGLLLDGLHVRGERDARLRRELVELGVRQPLRAFGEGGVERLEAVFAQQVVRAGRHRRRSLLDVDDQQRQPELRDPCLRLVRAREPELARSSRDQVVTSWRSSPISADADASPDESG